MLKEYRPSVIFLRLTTPVGSTRSSGLISRSSWVRILVAVFTHLFSVFEVSELALKIDMNSRLFRWLSAATVFSVLLSFASAAASEALANSTNLTLSQSVVIPPLWSYDFQPESKYTFGQQDWGRVFPQCNNPRRSPIDVSSAAAGSPRFVFYKFFSLSRFVLATYFQDPEEGFIVRIPSGQARLQIEGIREELSLTAIRVRSPAEHTIDGLVYPLALEYDFTFVDQDTLIRDRDPVGVRMSDLYTSDLSASDDGTASKTKSDPNFAAILSAMETFKHEGTMSVDPHLPVKSSQSTTYVYRGTITRPPCESSLIHIVTLNGHTVSAAQLRVVQKGFEKVGLKPATGNAKSINSAETSVPSLIEVKQIRLYSAPTEPEFHELRRDKGSSGQLSVPANDVLELYFLNDGAVAVAVVLAVICGTQLFSCGYQLYLRLYSEVAEERQRWTTEALAAASEEHAVQDEFGGTDVVPEGEEEEEDADEEEKEGEDDDQEMAVEDAEN